MAQQPAKRRRIIQMDDEMHETLECPVCLKVPRNGNIYQCKQGHCLCSDCQPKLTKCPICRVALGKSPARNFIFEKILSKMAHACKFADQGCTMEEILTTLASHEDDCEFRLVNCMDMRCKAKVPQAKVLEHLEIEHKKEDFIEKSNPVDAYFTVSDAVFQRSKSATWLPIHINIKDEHFFVQMWRSGGGQWYAWVYMLAAKKKCEEYIYTVKVSGQDKMGQEAFSAHGHCVPLDHSRGKVTELGTCLMFTDAQARRLRANGKIKYHVNIQPVG